MKDLMEINKTMNIDKRIVNYESAFSDVLNNKYFLNSEGARISYEERAARLFLITYAKEKDLQNLAEVCGGLKGYEILKDNYDMGKKNSQKALALLNSKKIDPGNYDVVLDYRMAGVLAHEAVGHACEADGILTGESCFRGRGGQKIGSDLVNIFDDATIKNAYGSYPYDDEGVKAQKKILIKKGVISDFLHSRETADKMETHSSGNARAESVSHFPIVRMSNTHFAPGDHSKEEVFDLSRCILVEGMNGGQVDLSTGNFQFAAESGRLFEKGEEKKILRDIVISGNLLKILNRIDAVGKEKLRLESGHCGKGAQTVRVSDGGPSVRVRGVKIA